MSETLASPNSGQLFRILGLSGPNPSETLPRTSRSVNPAKRYVAQRLGTSSKSYHIACVRRIPKSLFGEALIAHTTFHINLEPSVLAPLVTPVVPNPSKMQMKVFKDNDCFD
ncbi:hypothetical protein PIB30_043249 [Stylosanthes scabra]|uniref:Uncharacterized protein n=1 Tax=Stylosanthes scabra TaxID=79078 RepID=A0ABU6SFE8_9FABA|nr:hypothetical protein [Stylosanthes scabra]